MLIMVSLVRPRDCVMTLTAPRALKLVAILDGASILANECIGATTRESLMA